MDRALEGEGGGEGREGGREGEVHCIKHVQCHATPYITTYRGRCLDNHKRSVHQPNHLHNNQQHSSQSSQE